MSNNKAAKLGAAALGLAALLCAAMVAIFVGSMLKARGYTGKRVKPVVVALRDLPAATQFTPADLKVADWPEDSVPTGAFSEIDDLFKADGTPVPSAGILKGEPVVKSRLASASEGTGVARLLKENMRAVALRVDDAVGKTNLVYPGVYVDVIVTIRVRDEEQKGVKKVVSRTAVERARVLTVGTRTDVSTRVTKKRSKNSSAPDSTRTYVTLEVTPKDAEIIAMARNEGNLNLALRNSNDTSHMIVPSDQVDEEGKNGGEATTSESAVLMNSDTSSLAGKETSSLGRQAHSSRNRTRGSIRVRKPRSSKHRSKNTNSGSSIETYSASE